MADTCAKAAGTERAAEIDVVVGREVESAQAADPDATRTGCPEDEQIARFDYELPLDLLLQASRAYGDPAYEEASRRLPLPEGAMPASRTRLLSAAVEGSA